MQRYIDRIQSGKIENRLKHTMVVAISWTAVPLEKRDNYMAALEQASVGQDIIPFTDFLTTDIPF